MDLPRPESTRLAERIRPPLRAAGRSILDRDGRSVRLRGVNWYGAESPDFVVGGLHRQPLERIVALITALGANCVRLPFSNQLVAENPTVPDAAVAANPALRGQSALAVFDQTVAALTAAGLAVILDNHTSFADWCCDRGDGNDLWHVSAYPEAVWIAHWTLLAQRYRADPLVIAADLRNEPRGPARWTSRQPAYSWRDAAERAGAAILAENPDLLIVVEGIDHASDVRGAADAPVRLPAPGRLVYSVHDYVWYHARPRSAQSMRRRWERRWGDLGNTPLFVGEFGLDIGEWTEGSDRATALWLRVLLDYLDERDASWTYWPLNGTMSSATPGRGRVFGAREPFGLLTPEWDGPANEGLTRWLFS